MARRRKVGSRHNTGQTENGISRTAAAATPLRSLAGSGYPIVAAIAASISTSACAQSSILEARFAGMGDHTLHDGDRHQGSKQHEVRPGDRYSEGNVLVPNAVHSVNHGTGEYVREDSTVNGVEALWCLFKLDYHDTFYHLSDKHLDRYCGGVHGPVTVSGNSKARYSGVAGSAIPRNILEILAICSGESS